MTFVKYERKLIRTHQYINEEIILFTSQTLTQEYSLALYRLLSHNNNITSKYISESKKICGQIYTQIGLISLNHVMKYILVKKKSDKI